MVAVMAVGIVVRSLCGHLKDKWTDKPVVAVDSLSPAPCPLWEAITEPMSWPCFLAERLGLYPAITTATDASGRPCLEERGGEAGRQRSSTRSPPKPSTWPFSKKTCPC